jgi:hypothetical protein
MGKIVADMVMVKGREERHPEGDYVISFYNPSLTWRKCGPKPADAAAVIPEKKKIFVNQWQGYKTPALEPGHEPILCFRAPRLGMTFAGLRAGTARVR